MKEHLNRYGITSLPSYRIDILKGLIVLNNNSDNLALDVLKEYGIVPDELTMIQGGTIKTVWKLNSKGRQLCLKRLKQTYDKSLFSVNAQIYVKNSGGKVPGVILNNNKEPITKYNEQLFVLYEWIDGKDLNFDIPADLHIAVQGLAAFHAVSKGYVPPENARISSKLGKWPHQYESMKSRMLLWKETAALDISQPHYKAYAQCTDSVIEIANMALKSISESDYGALTQFGSDSVVLCHQDYGKGNVIAAEDGTYILDLDGVTYDLAARDLRKILGKIAENKNQWQAERINEILSWYNDINPLSKDELEILYVDLIYPHWYFGLVKNLFQKNKLLKASEIERISKLEEAKVPVLTGLLKSVKK